MKIRRHYPKFLTGSEELWDEQIARRNSDRREREWNIKQKEAIRRSRKAKKVCPLI